MSKFNSECDTWRIRVPIGKMSYFYFDIPRPNFIETDGVVKFHGIRHLVVVDDDEDSHSGAIPVLQPI